MRGISNLVKSLIAQEFYSAFMLIDLNLNNTPFYFGTLPYDVNLKGHTYSPDHGLLTMETPKLGNSLTKDTYTIKFSDAGSETQPPFRFRAYCNNAPGSSSARIDAGFMNTSPASLISTSGFTIGVNQPILDQADLINMYDGVIDSLQYIMSEDNGIILEVKLTSPMGVLDASNVFYLTPHLLQRRTVGVYDTAFDNVSVSGKLQEILWGKIS